MSLSVELGDAPVSQAPEQGAHSEDDVIHAPTLPDFGKAVDPKSRKDHTNVRILSILVPRPGRSPDAIVGRILMCIYIYKLCTT